MEVSKDVKIETETAFIVAHQGILRLLCAQLANNKEYGKPRFRNCACLKIDTEDHTISLVYSDKDVDDQPISNNTPEKFWTKKSFNDKFTTNTTTKDIVKQNIELIKNNYKTIYLVRHGQGTHNIANMIAKTTTSNPELTIDGKKQAQILGKAIFSSSESDNSILFPLKKNIIANTVDFFVSILSRTWETLSYILRENNQKQNYKINPYVLSGIIEFSYKYKKN